MFNADPARRHDPAEAGLRGGRQRLSLRDLQRADGEGHPGPQVHRGGAIQQPPVRDQRAVGPGGGGEGNGDTPL